MDLFNNKYIAHLQREIDNKDARIAFLETRLSELLDAKMFNRVPERLQRITEPEQTATVKPPQATYPTTEMSDALSVAEADAWELSKPKENKE